MKIFRFWLTVQFRIAKNTLRGTQKVFFYIRFVERHWGVEIVRVEYFGLYISVLAVGFALKREKGGFSSCPSFHSGARSVWVFVCVERKL